VGTRLSPVRVVFEAENYFGKLWEFIIARNSDPGVLMRRLQ